MSDDFDPYHRWLGIHPKHLPADHYRLLGIELSEADPEVIRDATERQSGHVRRYALGQHAALCQKILNEIAAAKACLLDPAKKAEYDAALQRAAMPSSSRKAPVATLSSASAAVIKPASDQSVPPAPASRSFLERLTPAWLEKHSTALVGESRPWLLPVVRSLVLGAPAALLFGVLSIALTRITHKPEDIEESAAIVAVEPTVSPFAEQPPPEPSPRQADVPRTPVGSVDSDGQLSISAGRPDELALRPANPAAPKLPARPLDPPSSRDTKPLDEKPSEISVSSDADASLTKKPWKEQPFDRPAVSDIKPGAQAVKPKAASHEESPIGNKPVVIPASEFQPGSPEGKTDPSGDHLATEERTEQQAGTPALRSNNGFREVRQFYDEVGVRTLGCGPDDSRFISAGSKHWVLWDAASGKQLQTSGQSAPSISALACSPLGDILMTVTGVNLFQFWDLQTGRIIRHFKADSFLKTLRRIPSSAGRDQIQSFSFALGDIRSVHYAPDGRTVAIVGDDVIEAYELDGFQRIRSIKPHYDDPNYRHWCECAAISSDGTRAITGGAVKIIVWDLTRPTLGQTPAGAMQIGVFPGTGGTESVSISQDGRRAVSVSSNNEIRVWDLGRLGQWNPFTEALAGRMAVLSPDGKRMLMSGQQSAVSLWDVDTGRKIAEVPAAGERQFVFLPSSHGAISSTSQQISLWTVP